MTYRNELEQEAPHFNCSTTGIIDKILYQYIRNSSFETVMGRWLELHDGHKELGEHYTAFLEMFNAIRFH